MTSLVINSVFNMLRTCTMNWYQILTVTILKIHDFSKNYACLLPDEIQSLHWTQETASVYPVVVLRRVKEDVREDHLTFITDDKNHDVPFVEYCNNLLHEHYRGEGLDVTHGIEYNDGCASQFKCICALSALAHRSMKTTRIFCETSHGKSKWLGSRSWLYGVKSQIFYFHFFSFIFDIVITKPKKFFKNIDLKKFPGRFSILAGRGQDFHKKYTNFSCLPPNLKKYYINCPHNNRGGCKYHKEDIIINLVKK